MSVAAFASTMDAMRRSIVPMRTLSCFNRLNSVVEREQDSVLVFRQYPAQSARCLRIRFRRFCSRAFREPATNLLLEGGNGDRDRSIACRQPRGQFLCLLAVGVLQGRDDIRVKHEHSFSEVGLSSEISVSSLPSVRGQIP